MKDKENQVFGGYGNHDFPTEIKQERPNNTTSQSEKIVYGSLITSTKCYNCIHFPLCFAQKGGANLELASENDCCYYQSKLPKDSVVLSREDYEKVDKEIINKSTYDTIWKAGYNAYEKTIGECVAEARKETAEEFAEMLKEELENCSAIDGYDLEDLDFDGEIIQQCIDKTLSEIRQMLR